MKTKVLGVVIFLMGMVIVFPDIKCGIQKSRNEAQSTNSVKDTVSTKTTNVAQDTTVRVMTLFPSGQVTIQQPKPMEDVFLPKYELHIMIMFTIIIYSPIDFLLIDPFGRRIGFDPVKQKKYDEIPDAYYSYESIADLETGEAGTTTLEIVIKEPIDGAYQLQVIGTDSGLYSLQFLTKDLESNFSTKNFVGLMISEDEIHSYSFNYEKTVGYEIEVYSRLLSYDNAVKMTLPPGTTYFDMTIHYAKNILPATFIAKLNGLDVNNLFNPTPGGSETVTLNMTQSMNTLFLSVDGITIYREVIHEADTLEFRIRTTGEENFK